MTKTAFEKLPARQKLHGEGAVKCRIMEMGMTKGTTVHVRKVEYAIAHIEESIEALVEAGKLRWFAIKLFERDERVIADLKPDQALTEHLKEHIVAATVQTVKEPESYSYSNVENTVF